MQQACSFTMQIKKIGVFKPKIAFNSLLFIFVSTNPSLPYSVAWKHTNFDWRILEKVKFNTILGFKSLFLKKLKSTESRNGISERRDYVAVLDVAILVCGRFGHNST